MDGDTLKTLIALWGAVTGSIGLGWTVYAETTKRIPRVAVKCSGTIWKKFPSDPGDMQNEFIRIEIVNVGLNQVTIEGFAYCHLGSPSWFIVNPGTLGETLPRKLDPGERHVEMLPFKQFLDEGVDPGTIVLRAWDTMSRDFWAQGTLLRRAIWVVRWAVAHLSNTRKKWEERRKVIERVRAAQTKMEQKQRAG